MNTLKINNINTLCKINTTAVNDSTEWLHIRNINNSNDLTKQYKEIYQKYQMNNKWVLMINPENNSLDNIENTSDLSLSKILKVNSNKVNVKLENIETALRKGNCSAVIINNALFNDAELSQLYSSAKLGNTQCIILNTSKLIH